LSNGMDAVNTLTACQHKGVNNQNPLVVSKVYYP
jgi:hypothetical protein